MFRLVLLNETEAIDPASTIVGSMNSASTIVVSIDYMAVFIGVLIGGLGTALFLILKQKIAVNGFGDYLLRSRLIAKLIATSVLFYTVYIISTLEGIDGITIVAILAGIAGSAATFLFSTKGSKE